ncbi:hypothetical protein EYF80_030211 [Liparis tanakae]|uniref:Uncharacterized protein n=1 Tax=Liparis tanakae TaxID=230148 RepID=A0A4Z2H1V7_9TELE|nr:hypothetical protein EYF80_030211 [Liparis tanakae]
MHALPYRLLSDSQDLMYSYDGAVTILLSGRDTLRGKDNRSYHLHVLVDGLTGGVFKDSSLATIGYLAHLSRNGGY